MKSLEEFRVRPGSKVRLSKVDASYTGQFKGKDEGLPVLERNIRILRELQQVLYAESKHALLIVLQAMDAAGKDGTIRHVFEGFNPLGTTVTSFKVPTPEEAAHDFLWRVHNAVPKRGEIGVFNRSHYEEVLVTRVHSLVSQKLLDRRYDHINAFETMLADNGVTIRKFFLHISRDEQQRRFEERKHNPTKLWKLSPSDEAEAKQWDAYQEAYEEALSRCSTEHAPWYVIPANHKWFRNVAVSSILADTLQSLDMKYPKPQVTIEAS